MHGLSRLRIKYILRNGDSNLRRKLASELRAALSMAKFKMFMDSPQKRALIKMAAMLILTTSLMMHMGHKRSAWAHHGGRQPIVVMYKEGAWRA